MRYNKCRISSNNDRHVEKEKFLMHSGRKEKMHGTKVHSRIISGTLNVYAFPTKMKGKCMIHIALHTYCIFHLFIPSFYSFVSISNPVGLALSFYSELILIKKWNLLLGRNCHLKNLLKKSLRMSFSGINKDIGLCKIVFKLTQRSKPR